MQNLGQLIASIQDLANNFDGTVSIKNSQRRYFFVNESWLKLMKMERDNVIGKTDDDILQADHAAFVRQTDLEAAEKGCPTQYTKKTVINGEEITYVAIKWVINYQNGSPFCYCTIAHLYSDKEKVVAMQEKISSLLEGRLIEETDYTKD